MPHDDELMDQFLKETMADDVPRLSPGFDARVMRSVRNRRLSPKGRAVLGGYALVAVALAVLVMGKLPLWYIAASIAATSIVGIAVTAYGRRLSPS